MSDDVIDRLGDRFASAGLPAPPIPEDLGSRLRRVGDWWFSTRPDEVPPYRLDRYLDELEHGEPGDYLVVAHDGHGANSWALHYYLVDGPVAVFIQSSWGGAAVSGEIDREERAQLADRFEALRDLLAAAAGDPGGPDVAVVVSDLSSSGWSVRREDTWEPQATADPLRDAAALLRGR